MNMSDIGLGAYFCIWSQRFLWQRTNPQISESNSFWNKGVLGNYLTYDFNVSLFIIGWLLYNWELINGK